jgi:hypothetical protein
MAHPKKEYSLRKETVTARVRRQGLQGFEADLNRADQADRKAKYDAIRKLKKKTEW